jgi:hypothetical protein
MPKIHNPIGPSGCPHTPGLNGNEDIKLRILAANLRKQFAKDIPFTEEYKVGKALGGFTVGDSVKDLSLAEILIKLLGLTEVAIDPELPPDIPPIIGDDTLVSEIIRTKAPIYQINDNYEIVEVKFNFKTFNETASAAEPTDRQTVFYQVVNLLIM